MLKATLPLLAQKPVVNPRLVACLDALYRRRAILDDLIAALEAYRDDSAGCAAARLPH